MASVIRGSGTSSLGGDLDIEGVLTYEDVASVDSIGIVTARAGLHVTGAGSSLGVGTNDPQNIFQVGSTTEQDQRISIFSSTSSNDDSYGSLEFRHGVATGNKNAKISALRRGGSSGSDLAFYTRTQGDSVNNDGGEERLRITSAGLVHIGNNSAPLSNLNINGTGGQGGGIQINRDTSGSGPTSGQSLGSIAFKGVASANTNAAAEALIEATADENHTGSTAATDLVFYTKQSGIGPGSSPDERLRITSDGQLQATGAADVRLTLGSGGTAGTNDSVHIRADGANLKFMAASGGNTLFETNGTETLRISADGTTKTSWFSCATTGKTVNASDTAVLTINGSNPTFVQVYIKANFGANGALQAHFDYELITCDAQGSGGTTAIRQSLNESVGSFQISTSDFAVTKSGQNITITYTNQASGVNQISFYVKGKFTSLSLA